MEIVKVDDKGRIQIPKRDREIHGIGPGSQLAIEWDGDVMRVRPVPNPFDALAEDAIEDFHAGKTRSLRSQTR